MLSRRLRAIATGMVLLATQFKAALDPNKPISQYAQQIWQIQSGLPNNSVSAIVQTPDGYLWLGTERGLARFDGVRFTVFDTSSTPELKSDSISALLVDRAGVLWIGTSRGGLTSFKDKMFRAYSNRGGLSSNSIRTLYEDKSGALWIGTNGGGVDRLQSGVLRVYTTKDGLPDNVVSAIAENKDGTLWLGTHAGLVQVQRDKFTTYTSDDGLPDNTIQSIYIDQGGTIWIGTESGLAHFSQGEFSSYPANNGLANVSSLYEDGGGTLWIGTTGAGLKRLQNGKLEAYTAKNGMPSDQVSALFEDREGNLWIGMKAGGLLRLRDSAFTTITTQDGLASNSALTVYEDREGSVWVGTNGAGLTRIKHGQIVNYTTRNGLPDNLVTSTIEDAQGNLWIGTGKGLCRYRGGEFQWYGLHNGLPNGIITSTYVDRQGTLWVGTQSGLSRLDGYQFTTLTTKDGLSNNYVTSISDDASGTLWIGTAGGGLNAFRDNHFMAYTAQHGLASEEVWTIFPGSDALWVGTNGGGLSRFKNGKFTTYTTRDGLFDNTIFAILDDGHDYFWMSSARGPFRVSRRELNLFAQDRIKAVHATAYGVSDGMKSNECTGGFQPAAWKSRDGRLWFPTPSGVAFVDPNQLKRVRSSPAVILETAVADDKNIPSNKPVRLPSGAGRLQFEFTAPTFTDPDQIRFEYMLEGFDKGWVQAGRHRAAYYTNIPPGRYRFRVNARNKDGIWNSNAAASAEIELLPHFYQTYVFAFLCSIAGVALCFGVYRLWMGQLRANERKLSAAVEERTRALAQQVRVLERNEETLRRARDELQLHVLDLKAENLELRREEEQWRTARGTAEPDEEDLPFHLAGIRVLIVDDNPATLRTLNALLTNWGAQVTAIPDPNIALKEIQKRARAAQPFPLVLLDAEMPGLSGFDLAEGILESASASSRMIIMLSLPPGLTETARCRQLGIEEKIVKPVSPTGLRNAIAATLNSIDKWSMNATTACV